VPYLITYDPEVLSIDLPRLGEDAKKRLRKTIEERLAAAPHEYGQPLRKSLKGYWKLRTGDYRVVYKIEENEVYVLAIRHRRDLYDFLKKRV
jgi:mRNA interferase RelE/StbE